MPRFLAVYRMPAANVSRFRALPQAEQDAIDNAGVPLWQAWEKANSAAFRDKGGMVGKTLQVTKTGTAPATNDICGYVVVEADTIEAAARIFENHPHVSTFPGESIDIMPFVTDPS